MSTLSTITAHAPSFTQGASWVYSSSASMGSNQNSILSSYFFDPQGQGPIGSALRIVIKIHHSFRDSLLSIGFGGGRSKGKKGRDIDDELRGKAVKVLDLLQHAAELGHEKAIRAMADIYLVRALCQYHKLS
jgi:SEL1 protein